MKFKLLIIPVLLVSFTLKAQPPETIYPGTIVYEGYRDDAGWGPFNIGFSFTFYGNSYSQFYVTSNGLVMFGGSSGDYTEDPIPNTSTPNNFIAAFWDDLVINAAGRILYTTIGAAPNRKCIIQWTNMGFWSSTVLVGTFSVILYEGSNDIQIQYRSIIDNFSDRSHGSSATVGIENSNGTAGVQYAYHNSTAIQSELAIRFSPSGSTYTMDPSATYDGIYLTKNISLPEPGIPVLISPPNNATIGMSQTFEWTVATNATSYLLKISNNSDISGATDYNTGTSTSYTITNLVLNRTYYWAVFALNSTGTTWSEIKRFYTSDNPPLTAVPQTIWMEQNEERTIRLQYSGGDASTKTGVITSLPPQGLLYQYSGGLKGSLISSVPANVTDPGMNVIYVASGSTGNGAGNFDYKVQDNTGESPVVTVTVNVNPPGVPNFLLAAKSGNIEIQFDKPMADPSGKEDQFTVKVNGSPVVINSVSLKEGDPYTIVVTLAVPLTGSETVLISYTQGDVVSEAGGLLSTFVDQPVNFLIQTITFQPIPELSYGDPPVTLSATASSGLPVTFISSNTSVASVTGNSLNVNSTGTCLITAQQTGNGTYAPAKFIRSLTVNKADQTITFPPLPSRTYGDPDFPPGATSSSGLPVSYSSDNPDVAVITEGNIHITGAGTANITASQAGNNLYNQAPEVTIQLIVEKADQTINFNELTVHKYNDPDFDPGATASSGLTVTYSSSNTSVASIVEGMIHIVAPGTVTITASQTGNDNYHPAPDVSRILEIEKDDQSITFNPLPEVKFGDPDFTPDAVSSSSLPLTFTSANSDVAEIINGMIKIINAGSTVITANQSGNEYYNPAPPAEQVLVVGKASQVITFPDMPDVVYGDPDFDPVATASSGLPVTYSSSDSDIATIVGSMIKITGVGEVTITAYQSGNNNFLEAAPVSKTLRVGKASQTIIFPELPHKVFGDPDSDPQAYASSGLDITYSSSNPLVAVIINNLIHITGAGVTTITASQAGNQNYLAAADVSVELTVEKANQSITFSPLNEVTFGDSDIYPEAFASSGLQVTFQSKNHDIAVVVDNRIVIVGAGSAEIVASQDGNENYYPAQDVSQILIVRKANQTITFNPLPDAVFGDPPLEPVVSSSSGLEVILSSENTGVAMISGNQILINGAGTVLITASQPGNNNYNPAENVSVLLTVRKADQNIVFQPLGEVKYGAPPITPEAIASSGLAVSYISSDTDVAEIVNGKISIKGTGVTIITASQNGNENYNPAGDVTSTLTVTKASLTFSANNVSREYLRPNPVLTFTVTGFVYDDNINDLNDLPVLTTEATVDSPVGEYEISIAGGSDDCYDFIYNSGILTITKISQTITVTEKPEELLMNSSFQLAAIASSGLPVAFESLNTNVAVVSGSVLTGKAGGTVIIRAYNNGNENYGPAETTFEVRIITTHRNIMNLFTPNNDGFNDYWEIPDLVTFGKCEVKVYNRWGKLVFHSNDYHNEWDGTSNGEQLPSAAYYYIIKTENAGTINGTVNIVR